MYREIIVESGDGITTVTLNRPEKLNALTVVMMGEFLEVLRDLENEEDLRVLIVKGSGRAFSAGVDLKETDPADFGNDTGIIRLGSEIGNLLASFPAVTIARIHGFCFTGALELALMFDLMYCTNDTLFGDTHAKWAIMPRWGMTQHLARRVGLNKAKELTFRAFRVAGGEAAKIGLVNDAFDSDQFDEAIARITEDIRSNDREAIARIKTLYNEGYGTTLNEGLQLERDADPRLSSTAEILRRFEKMKNK